MKWPPRRAPAVSGRSRLTRWPGLFSAKLVRRRVSPERSAEKWSAVNSTMVRQQPFTEMLSPNLVEAAIAGSDAAVELGKLMRSRPPSGACSRDSIFPACSVMPVNICVWFLWSVSVLLTWAHRQDCLCHVQIAKISLDYEIGAAAFYC